MITGKQLVRRIAEKYNCPYTDTKLWFDAIINELGEAMLEDSVKIKDFGVFEQTLRKAHKGNDIYRGQAVDVPARIKITFRPGRRIDLETREFDVTKYENPAE